MESRADNAPSPRRARIVLGALTLALLTLAAAACGGSVGYSEGTGDRARGKELFIQGCGSCHTLQDAGTKGQIGPNLDYAFLQSRRNGLGEDTIQQVVRGQIAYPTVATVTGAPGMPADIFTGDDAEDVATYVASVAGIGVEDGGSQPAPPPSPTPPPAAGDGDAAKLEAGKNVFATAGCGSCHTLADAGSSGQVGPNLDEAMPDEALVVERVTNGQGAMPPFKDQLSAEQIDAVALYVSTIAGSSP